MSSKIIKFSGAWTLTATNSVARWGQLHQSNVPLQWSKPAVEDAR